MTTLDTVEVHSRTITAFFESKDAAQKAVSHLEQAGIPSQHITLVPGNDMAAATTSTEEPGLWASLKEMFLPDEDRHAYAEGLRRGGYLLSVKTDEANYDRVLDIVDVDGSVDMDEREATWKSEGWTGYTAAPAATAAVASATTVSTAARETVVAPPVAASPPAPMTALGAGKDEAISLYEEKLQVGKRDVNHGRVRIRSYVVETPVNEQITLHSERVEIDRKAVDRPVSAADALFTDRVIEVEEHAEEAVIAKEVRVKEEISLRKTADNKVQTVTDTVRRTEVEIDDARLQRATGSVRKFVATQDADLIVEHMDVIASDGTKVGTVDHMEGADKIKLAKSTSPDGQHHYVPLAWVDHIDAHVHLSKPAAAVKAGW